jgi:hypothetical protein
MNDQGLEATVAMYNVMILAYGKQGHILYVILEILFVDDSRSQY